MMSQHDVPLLFTLVAVVQKMSESAAWWKRRTKSGKLSAEPNAMVSPNGGKTARPRARLTGGVLLFRGQVGPVPREWRVIVAPRRLCEAQHLRVAPFPVAEQLPRLLARGD